MGRAVLDPDDHRERLEMHAAALREPTLLIRGALSDVVSREGAREFRELCLHAECVELAGVAHALSADSNDPFIDALLEFLARTAPSAPPKGPSGSRPRERGQKGAPLPDGNRSANSSAVS